MKIASGRRGDVAIVAIAAIIALAGFVMPPSVSYVPSSTQAPQKHEDALPNLSLLRHVSRQNGSTGFSLDVLRADDRPAVVLAARPASVSVSPERRFEVDGWAIDEANRAVPRAVFLTIDSVAVCGCAAMHPRRDVATVYREPNYFYSGFTCDVAANVLRGGAHVLGLDVLSAKGDHFVYVSVPTVVMAR